MNRTIKTLLTTALVSLCAVGCAGGRTTLVANDARYPISMSPGVRDSDGSLVEKERRETVGTFRDERTAWGMLYSGVKLTPKKDISSQVNRQVATVKGDAVVNLRVRTTHCAWNFVPVLNLLPIWPGCTNVHVEGDIVRVSRRRSKDAPLPVVEPRRDSSNIASLTMREATQGSR
jgi:hypothetical protein